MFPANVIPFRPRRRPPRAVTLAWGQVWRRIWRRRFDLLAAYLETLKDKETRMDDLRMEVPANESVITMSRTFDAPPRLVWRALSEPRHLVRWFGPHRHANRVLEFDFRVGGKWRIETTTAEGVVLVFHGEFRDIREPMTITQTFGVEGMFGGGFSIDTVTLEEHGGRTIYRATSRLPDLAARAAMLASGMESGVREGFERLDGMLLEFRAEAAT